MAFLNLGTRGKAILAIGIILVLCLLGVLGYLVKTGKIKSSADTLSNNITVTVSGNASDRNLNKPIGNAQFSIKPLGLPAVTVATDATGNYKKSITVNKTDQTQNIVSVAISSPDYPQIIDSSYVDLSIPSDAKTGFSVTQNFSLGKTDDYDLIHNRLVNGDFEL